MDGFGRYILEAEKRLNDELYLPTRRRKKKKLTLIVSVIKMGKTIRRIVWLEWEMEKPLCAHSV